MIPEIIDINEIVENPKNPRVIRTEKLKALVKSIEEFPEMMNLRTIVLNKDKMVIGGNMRLAACKILGIEKVPVLITDFTPEEEQEFLIKDNINHGEWDWEALANDWEAPDLNLWGLNVWIPDHQEEFTPKIQPLRAKEEITEEDMQKAELILAQEMRLGKEKIFVECKCPSCQNEFKIER